MSNQILSFKYPDPGEIHWFFGFHGPPTPAGQELCCIDKGRSLDVYFIHELAKLFTIYSTTKNRPVLYVCMVPDLQGSAVNEIQSHWGTFNDLEFSGPPIPAGQGPYDLETDGPL